MAPEEKASLIALVRSSPLLRKQVLAQLDLPKSTYYDWLRRREDELVGAASRSPRRVTWNRLRPEEEQAVLGLARAAPELQRQLERMTMAINRLVAAVLLAADDFAGAMEELLFIARTDRGFRHDIGRTSLLALFDLLGSAHPLTRQYRQALSESLH